MFEPKSPDSYRDWKAIDIYLFDNGEAHSPPRKYHLVADQLEWWPVTINYLANTQYGLINQTIDLYTLDGHKIKTPLELKNDTAYVAVKPPDTFIEAEYEKYLVRSSRSREQRQSLREHNAIANTDNSRTPVGPSDTDKIPNEISEVKYFHANSLQTPEESFLIQTILVNKPAEKPNSVVVKPTDNDKRTNQNNVQILPTIKNNRDMRSSKQQFSGNKIPVSLSQPQPVKRPSLKRKESVRLSDAKITPPPDFDKINIGSKSEPSREGNLPNKSSNRRSIPSKPIGNKRNSTQPRLSKVAEVINELKKYSNEKELDNSKNVISLNENEIMTTIVDKNADSNVESNLSAIYIDVTTLKQFKDNLNAEKSKETPKTNRESTNKIFENENLKVNELKQDTLQIKEKQMESPVIATETSVNNPRSKMENKSKRDNVKIIKGKTKRQEQIIDTSDNNLSNVADKLNVQDNLKPTNLMVTDQYIENAPNGVGVTNKYANSQDNLLKTNNLITNNEPINVVLNSENKIHDNHSKPGSIITFQKPVNNGSSLEHKNNLISTNDTVQNVAKNPVQFTSENTTNKSVERFMSTSNKNEDINPEPTSEITIEKLRYFNDIKNVSSAVYRAEVDALIGNYQNVRASTLALAGDITTVYFVETASNTDEVIMLSVNDNTENVQDNLAKSANESSDRFIKNNSTSVGGEDVVNLKLSIDIWNHNSTIDSRPTVASIRHSPNISNQNEFQGTIPDGSNLIHKQANTTNEINLGDNEKIVIIKYVSRHPKDEKPNSNESPKSNSKDFTIILPILNLDHMTGCCSHCQQKDPNYKEDSQKIQVSSIIYPVRKTTSCTSLLHFLSRFENRESDDITADALVNQSKEPSTIKGTKSSREPSCVTKDKVPDNRESISRRKSVAINEELNSKESHYSVSITSENPNKGQMIVNHDKEFQILEKTDDKAIQTEWCNLMMEARLQEDGHYALFLPSIEKLKQYKLHTN